jgi:hypothetical protein
VSRSDALELVLRCLDQRSARGRSLGLIEPEQVCHDFNLVFAGAQAAAEADRDARQIAATETAARQKASRERYALALKAARAKGARSRARLLAVKTVAPVPTLAPGFESLAESGTKLSRVETCLLLASALRLQPSQLSALERAASRVANSG